MRKFHFIDQNRAMYGNRKFHLVMTTELVFIHSCLYSQIIYYISKAVLGIGKNRKGPCDLGVFTIV